MRNRTRVLVLIVVAAASAGCATRYYWTKPGASWREFMADNRACAASSTTYTESSQWAAGLTPRLGLAGGESFKGYTINEASYRMCMRERDWQRSKLSSQPVNGYRGVTDEP